MENRGGISDKFEEDLGALFSKTNSINLEYKKIKYLSINYMLCTLWQTKYLACIMRHLTILFFFAFISTTSLAQELQAHYESPSDENHYTIAYPTDWGGDYFVIGTIYPLYPLKKNAYMKRIDEDGNIVWEFLLSTFWLGNQNHNIAFHVDESSWGNGDITVVGFESNDTGDIQQGLIYGVKSDGTITNLLNLDYTGDELWKTNLMHIISTDPSADGAGWIAVGVQNGDGDQNGLVIRIDVSGNLLWCKHISTPNDLNTLIDFDGLSHVVEVPGGFFLSGSGNFENEDGSGYKQGALATMINYDGEVLWSNVYSHVSSAHSTVAASATYTDNGKLYQIANGQGNAGNDHGFFVNRIGLIDEGWGVVSSRNYNNFPTPFKAMTLRNHKTDSSLLIVSGFLELPDCPNNGNCGFVPGDHPPFLMQIQQQPNGTNPIDWIHIYDVPSTSYGNSGNTFDLFTNINQPYIYHPEMMLPITNTSDALRYLIAGLHTQPLGPIDYDLELILTDENGITQCPTFQPAINTPILNPIIQENIAASVDYYGNYYLSPDISAIAPRQSNYIPCDYCPVPIISYSIYCDYISLNVTLPNGDPSNLCFEVDFGDGSLVETFTGEQSIIHNWEEGFSEGEMCVTSWCCDDPTGVIETQCFTISLECVCSPCIPFIKACQINLDEPMSYYPPAPWDPVPDFSYLISFLECQYGCDTAPHDVELSLGHPVYSSLLGSCLDDVSVKWYIDALFVGETPCGMYNPILLTDYPSGIYTVTAELTNCIDNSCINEVSTSLTVGNCIVPPNPQIEIHEHVNDDDCSIPNCNISFCPLQLVCSTMTASWYVDEVYAGDGSCLHEQCFGWGFHKVELRYVCQNTGDTSSAIEYIYCGLPYEIGPDLFPIDPYWLPQYFPMSAEIDTDCNLKIDFGNMDTEVTGTFSPFQSIGESTFEGFLDGIDPSEKFFSWRITAIEENGNENIIVEHNSFSNTALTSFTNDLITVKDTFDQLISLRFELTGPEWLVSQTNPGTLSYEIPVSDCPPAVICASDIDGDSYVNVNDLLALLGDFGTACE